MLDLFGILNPQHISDAFQLANLIRIPAGFWVIFQLFKLVMMAIKAIYRPDVTGSGQQAVVATSSKDRD
jgi:hypothetical protein